MPLTVDDARTVALALPDTTEEPHHHYGSFRVRGRIFVTIPPGDEVLHIFLPEDARMLAQAAHPEFLEPLLWGGKVTGLRVLLRKARKAVVLELVRHAYEWKRDQGPARAPSPRKK